MKIRSFIAAISILFISLSIFSCSENIPPEPNLNPETKTELQAKTSVEKKLNKIGVFDPKPDQLEYGTKRETEYVLHHYIANSEFGIMPTEYRQFAGSSGDPNRIQKLNELKSKWGFNYIAACIGVYENIQAIVNAGFPISTNYLAAGFCTGGDGDRATVQNLNNGLSSSTYFWGYYFDEPYSHDCSASITQASFKNFRDFVKGLRPNSLFGLGETNVYTANRYTHNPYFWFGTYYPNYNPTSVDFVMCTKYTNYSNNIDQRPLWDELQSKYNGVYSRTWIAAHADGSEFRNLLGYCRDHGYAPWFYQMQDGYDYNDQMIASYCEAAWLEGFLQRYDTQYEVWYHCILSHTHDPEAPWECLWVEDGRISQGIVQR